MTINFKMAWRNIPTNIYHKFDMQDNLTCWTTQAQKKNSVYQEGCKGLANTGLKGINCMLT